MRLAVMHNLYYYNHLMEEIREALKQGRFAAFKKAKLAGYEENPVHNTVMNSGWHA